MSFPLVALVGRPNVGKSTLFNVLTGTRDALVADVPGVTRDRQYGVSRHAERSFIVVDTGGIGAGEDELASEVEKQVKVAVEQADLVLMLVDAQAGVLPADYELIADLRRRDKRFILIVNKAESSQSRLAVSEFYSLGAERQLSISATQRIGVDELLRTIKEVLPADGSEDQPQYPRPFIALLGRPNVGKSSLLNRLVGTERSIAEAVPGTTRDVIRVPLDRGQESCTLLDTAGLRRKSQVRETVETFSALKTLAAIELCDIASILVDATEGVTDQDLRIYRHVTEAGRGCLVAANKVDLLDMEQRRTLFSELQRRFHFDPQLPLVGLSARTGKGIDRWWAELERVKKSLDPEISTHELSEILQKAIEAHPPPGAAGRNPKLRYAHWGAKRPLTLIIHGTRVAQLPDSYKRYLHNRFRAALCLTGVPLRMVFRGGTNPYAGKRNQLSHRQQARKRRFSKVIRKYKRRDGK